MNPESLRNLLALNFIPKIGPVHSKNLVSYCGGVEGIFKANKAQLQKVPGIGEVLATTILKHRSFERADKELEFMEKNNIRAITYFDEDYPLRYKMVEDSPIILFTKGIINMNIPKVLAIVGTRKNTQYGKDSCNKLIEDLASSDVLIVSGLAYGTDVWAHNAAIKNNLQTVGVLAHGLDRIYPLENKPTAKKMVENGGLITEYPSGTKPDKENFVQRNRIIAGIADAVVIIESAMKGGSLLTATFASNYNRDVFAFSGRTTDTYSQGCHYIIKRNLATLIESADDVIYNMGWDEDTKPKKVKQVVIDFNLLSDEQKIIYDIIKVYEGGLDIDTITIKSNIFGGKVAGILLQMEFAGILRSLPGKIFQLV